MEKKTPLNGTVTGLDGHALVQRYEALRREVAQPGNSRPDVRGLALLVHKGMAAWMQGLSKSCTDPVATPAQRDGCAAMSSAGAAPAQRAVGLERMLVNILAAMTQANTLEVCT